MKQNSTKSLKWLTGIVAAFGLISVALMAVQTSGFFLGRPVGQKIVWIPEMEFVQGSIAIFRFLGGTVLYATLVIFMANSVKALNNGTLFPRKNIGLLFCAAASSFIFLFCDSNVDLILGTAQIQVSVEEIIVPSLICAIAIIYRTAVKVSEENNLTI